jgi:outer membrane protein insertion porin family
LQSGSGKNILLLTPAFIRIKSVKVRSLKFLFIWSCILLASAALWGQEVRVERVKFKGNESVPARKLQEAILTQGKAWYHRFFLFWKKGQLFDEDIFLADLLRLERFYRQEGYLEARVENYDLKFNDRHNQVTIVIYIEEGKPTNVASVDIIPADHAELPIAETNLLKSLSLKKGKPYREEDLKLDYNKIIEQFSNRGYPYIQARVKPVVDQALHRAALEWYLEPGPLCSFGEIDITGNERVASEVIRRGLRVRSGRTFSQKRLVESQSDVYRLDLFQFVSLHPMNLEAKPLEIPIEVRVKESVPRTLKLGVGYGSEESFRGSIQLRHRNFLGGGRLLRVLAKHSTKLLPVQLELELSQPFFLSNRNDLITKPFFIWQDEKGFEARRLGFEITITRQLTRRTQIFASSRVERDTVRVKGTDVAPELASLFNKSVLRAGIRRNSVDDLFYPTSGHISTFVAEEAGRFLRTPFKYVKLFTEHRFYRQLAPRHVLATRLFIGSMGPIRGSRETPIEERFFAGGNYSVRGWGRQLLGPVQVDTTGAIVPLGGDSALEGSFEYRYPVYKDFTGAVFLDYGNVWEDWNGFDLLGLRYAVGLGVRYNTFIGPIRLDVAWKINKQPIDENRFQFHISIGQAF